MKQIYIALSIALSIISVSLQAQVTQTSTISADPYDFWIAADTGNLEIVKLCVEKGMFIDLAYEDNVTPLMLATQGGHKDIVEYLVSKGANVNAHSEFAEIPVLTSAVLNNDLEIAEYLIRHRSEINKTDLYGRQAIHYAASNSFYTMCKMLLYYDADPDKADYYAYTPIYYATASGDTTIIELLLNNGVNVVYSEKEPNLLIQTAASYNDLELVKFLYGKGLSLSEKNSSNLSLFDEFTINGNIEALKWLQEKGLVANDSITTFYNTRNLAYLSKNKEVKKLIKGTGIKPIHKPYFNKLGLSFSLPFNKTDVFFDFNSFIYDTRYGFQVSLGTKIRPGKKAAWIPQEENVYYQLFEKRYGVYIGLYKHFRVPKHLNFKHRIVLGVEPSLSFNNFTALSEKQAPTVIISPVAGVHINLASNVNLELSYTYCQLGIININPHRIRVGLNVSFGFRPYKTDFDNYYIIKE